MFSKNNSHHYDYYVNWECYAPTGSVYVPELRDDGSLRLSSGYEDEVKEVLDLTYPLPSGLRWEVSRTGGYNQSSARPYPVEGENTFTLMEQGRENEIWLDFNHGFGKRQTPKIGDQVRVRERGGFVTVTVEAILEFRGFAWVRGRWSDGEYLPVEEFLAGMPTIEDIAAHRKHGDLAWQGSAT